MASSSRPQPDYSPDTCMFCTEPLRISSPEDDADSEFEGGPSTIIDDVELYCGPPGSGPSGHHAHWSCLINQGKEIRASSGGARCLVCGQNTLDVSGRFIVDVRNEGGETKGFDFGEVIDEELFLEDHPDQVHIRAFHDLVAQGEYEAVTELMSEHDVDVNCTFGTDGLTALQKAMFSGDTKGVEFLQSLGATA
ncbi:hypothetical protein HYDPIDRAFT_108490 [Hydnomerulius pinastri MD-312]|nr:hypothetical protein HYDPIDRAFT_108490 [Hydnomerulius pinastri MD-312]